MDINGTQEIVSSSRYGFGKGMLSYQTRPHHDQQLRYPPRRLALHYDTVLDQSLRLRDSFAVVVLKHILA